MAYNGIERPMVILETSIFTRLVTELLSDFEYSELQQALLDNPERGDVMRGTGGLRKLRWRYGSKGKKGGIRSIYYWAKSDEQILMLYMFKKSERDDLTNEQCKILRKIVEEEYK